MNLDEIIQNIHFKLNNEYIMLKEPYIRTYSGINFTILNPTSEMINIDDIAHSLSYQCRYGGHSNKFYSVARHSIIMSYLAPPKFALDALCHDMGEAYIRDLPSPIKKLLPAYCNLEDNIYAKIAFKFNLNNPIPDVVKQIDQDMIGYEWDFFMEKKPNPQLKEFYKKHFSYKNINQTKRDFLQRFEELSL